MRDPSRVRVAGPLGRYASGFAGELARVGYTPNSAALQLGLMAHVSRWLAESDLVPEQLSAAGMERFLSARRAAGYTNHASARGLEPLLGYLRGLGVVPPVQAPVVSAAELLLANTPSPSTVKPSSASVATYMRRLAARSLTLMPMWSNTSLMRTSLLRRSAASA